MEVVRTEHHRKPFQSSGTSTKEVQDMKRWRNPTAKKFLRNFSLRFPLFFCRKLCYTDSGRPLPGNMIIMEVTVKVLLNLSHSVEGNWIAGRHTNIYPTSCFWERFRRRAFTKQGATLRRRNRRGTEWSSIGGAIALRVRRYSVLRRPLGDGDRILFRESGSRLLVRVMVETKSQDCCREPTEDIAGVLREKWSK